MAGVEKEPGALPASLVEYGSYLVFICPGLYKGKH